MRDAVRSAWRRLRATPIVSTMAMLTMALGIGAATAAFSVADDVLLRPLPYPGSERLVMIWDRWQGWPSTWISDAEFLDYREKARSFSVVGAWTDDQRNLTGGDHPQRVHVGIAAAGVFQALGVAPLAGRIYTAEEDHAGAARVALMSERLWRERYNANPHVIGSQVVLDDSSTTVIGIMPASFQLPLDFAGDAVDLWVPLALGFVDRTVRGGHYLNAIARLHAGVTPDAANQEVERMSAQMTVDYPRGYPPNFGAFARTVTGQVIGDIRPTVLVVTIAVGLILLIACANVANLLLARAHSRQREIAIRAALGASGAQIMRLLFAESLLLAGLSGIAGLALATVGTHFIASAAPRNVPRISSVSVDSGVLLFAAAATFLTGIVCGMAPALHAFHVDLLGAVKEAGAGGGASNRGGERTRRTLIGVEVALSIVLLVGAGLLLRSFARLESIDPGFDPQSVLTARVSLPAAGYQTNAAIRGFFRDALQRVTALPGVEAAAVVRVLPMTSVMGDWSFRIAGRSAPGDGFTAAGDWQVVSPSYFRVMRIPLRSGRFLSDADDDRAQGAVVVNEALAARAWPGESPLGQRIQMGGMDTTWRTVVGVIGNVRHRGLDADPRPELYLPHAQWTNGGSAVRDMYLVLRTRRDPATFGIDLRRTIQSIDPDLPVASIRAMTTVLSDATAARRISFIVLATLAVAAAGIAAVGLYGVISFAVAQRTNEIGIRRALGASAGTVVRVVMQQATGAVVAGLASGLVLAAWLSRFMATMLFQVRPMDPITFLFVVALVSLVAVVASYIPARRATQIDPLTAVRST